MQMNTFIQLAIGGLLLGAAGWAAADSTQKLAALESAATLGEPRAQTELAVAYEHAEGVPRDLEKSRALYCQAAKHGFADAQFKLGWLYANGRGVARDDAVAAALFEMAAEQGHEHAAKLLKYFGAHGDAQLPTCVLPDPPVATEVAGDDEQSLAEQTAADKAVEPADPEPDLAPRTEIEKLVYQLAPQYSVDPRLAMAVISVESAFNPVAVSPKNAQGLMQLIPETAERFGVRRVFSPAENIKGGLAYLRWLLAFFKGNVALVAAAYNAGERAVERYRGVPPYEETRRYVKKITGLYTKSSHPYEHDVVEPSLLVAPGTRKRG